MAILFKTDDPVKLLRSIKKGIDDGHIDTWTYNADGDFIHTRPQWRLAAKLRPKISAGKLQLGILKQGNTNITIPIYGIYHGRFIEMVLNHFDKQFSDALATALGAYPDVY